MSIGLIVAGLVFALFGAYVGSSVPIVEMARYGGSWGGGEEDQWTQYERLARRKFLASNVLLVLGTALQIAGTLRG